MKRRDFVKTSLCLGCAGALGAGAMLCKKEGLTSLSDIKTFLGERKFLYKSKFDLPKKIRIDICNLCQLHCPACWVRKNEELIKNSLGGFGYVAFQTFKNFVDRHPFIKEIELSLRGEIFLNPELEDIVEYSYEKGIKLSAVAGVNLNTLSEKMAETLVKYQFQKMVVSIDGATPEIYAIYRQGGDLNKVIHNIKTINKYKEKYNSKYPVMIYKFILFGHNVHEIEKAKKLAKELDIPIWFAMNNDPEYSPLNPKDEKKILDATGEIMFASDVQSIIKQYQTGKQSFCFCSDMYYYPQINYNGDLFGCGMAYTKTYGINVFKEGLLKALNNKKVLYAKMMLSDFTVEPRDDIPCTDCYMYSQLKEKELPIKRTEGILTF